VQYEALAHTVPAAHNVVEGKNVCAGQLAELPVQVEAF
jgi:hypothetical protein